MDMTLCGPHSLANANALPISLRGAYVDAHEPIVNQHIATITDLDEKIAAPCIALSEQREQIQSRTGFHWWP
ncbi:MAG: hypothetical protein WCC90_07190, partial [Methylocella sp.]